nr:retrotransposable element Tf2 [Tanacetum cinerariifolium]
MNIFCYHLYLQIHQSLQPFRAQMLMLVTNQEITHDVIVASPSINTASNIIDAGSLNINIVDSNHTNMLSLEATGIFDGAFDDRDLGAVADTNNLDSSTVVSPIPTTRVHKDHPKKQIIGDSNLNTQTRRMINFFEETAIVSFINRQRKKNHKDFQNYLFACFLSQMEPKKVIHTLKDPSWIEAMQEELFQFKLQDVWTLVDLPYEKRVIGTKWVFRNKLDKRGLWYPKHSDFELEAYTDSDYAGSSLDMESTTGGCQFLGCRLISWQCKKQTVVANSTTKAEYVSALSYCGQVKIEHQRASGLLQPLDIPVWKWDEISMDFVIGLPRTQKRHDVIWVVVDRLTKSTHFLPIRKDYSVS